MIWLKYNNQTGCVSGLYGLPIPCASLAYPLLFDTRKERGGQGEYVGIILIIVSKNWMLIWGVSGGFGGEIGMGVLIVWGGLAESEGATEVEEQETEHEGGCEVGKGKEPVAAIHKAERVCREGGERGEGAADAYRQEQVGGGAAEMSVTLCETEQEPQQQAA